MFFIVRFCFRGIDCGLFKVLSEKFVCCEFVMKFSCDDMNDFGGVFGNLRVKGVRFFDFCFFCSRMLIGVVYVVCILKGRWMI